MKTYFWYKALRRTTIQFLDLLNDIKVAKYDNNGDIIKYVAVPLKLWPKTKTWMWLNDRKEDKSTPMMTCQLTGISYDDNRAAGVNFYNDFNKDVDLKIINRYLTPVPYNLDFRVMILCQYMVELDQILEQILPYFSPNVIMRISIEEIGVNYDVKVILDNCSPDVDSTMAEEDYRMLIWSLDFVVHGFMFKPITDSKIIDKIVVDVYTNLDSFIDVDTTATITSAASAGQDIRMLTVGVGLDDGDILYKYEKYDD